MPEPTTKPKSLIKPRFGPIKVLRDGGEPMPWWHWLIAAIVLAAVVLVVLNA